MATLLNGYGRLYCRTYPKSVWLFIQREPNRPLGYTVTLLCGRNRGLGDNLRQSDRWGQWQSYVILRLKFVLVQPHRYPNTSLGDHY